MVWYVEFTRSCFYCFQCSCKPLVECVWVWLGVVTLRSSVESAINLHQCWCQASNLKHSLLVSPVNITRKCTLHSSWENCRETHKSTTSISSALHFHCTLPLCTPSTFKFIQVPLQGSMYIYKTKQSIWVLNTENNVFQFNTNWVP